MLLMALGWIRTNKLFHGHHHPMRWGKAGQSLRSTSPSGIEREGMSCCDLLLLTFCKGNCENLTHSSLSFAALWFWQCEKSTCRIHGKQSRVAVTHEMFRKDNGQWLIPLLELDEDPQEKTNINHKCLFISAGGETCLKLIGKIILKVEFSPLKLKPFIFYINFILIRPFRKLFSLNVRSYVCYTRVQSKSNNTFINCKEFCNWVVHYVIVTMLSAKAHHFLWLL